MIKNINRKWQPKQMVIMNEDNKVLMDKGEVVKRWTRNCSDLYVRSEKPTMFYK
jgi:hypothetical protein